MERQFKIQMESTDSVKRTKDNPAGFTLQILTVNQCVVWLLFIHNTEMLIWLTS